MSLRKRITSHWTVENITRVQSLQEAVKSSGCNDGENLNESATGATTLRRVLGVVDLIGYGIGSTVGAGIFVVYGVVAREKAGPAIVVSFLLAAFASLLSALCYAEFASRVPLSGSAYTFAYLTLGEVVGWLIGWNMTLEYAVSASAVARGWSSYIISTCRSFFHAIGVDFPDWLKNTPTAGGFFNIAPLPAVILGACTLVLLRGIKGSSRFNNGMAVLNVSVILIVICAGFSQVDTSNWDDFFPFGIGGAFKGAGTVFFSYIGFDSVSTLAGEVKNPKRNLPIGIVGTLVISTILYVSVSLAITGMVRYDQIDVHAPLAEAFSGKSSLRFVAILVAMGAVTTLTATTLCSLIGQPRVFYQMAKDGLLFGKFGTVSRKTAVPVFGTVVTGIGSTILAVLFDIDTLADTISIGTLLAFTVVCAGVLLLRYRPLTSDHSIAAKKQNRNLFLAVLAYSFTSCACMYTIDHAPWFVPLLLATLPLAVAVWFYRQPLSREVPDGFLCPLIPFIPLCGITVNVYIITQLELSAVLRLLIWTILGLLVYAFYGIRHSKLNFRVSDSDRVEEDLIENDETPLLVENVEH